MKYQIDLSSIFKKKVIVNYLHIGKTGGSQIKYILNRNSKKNFKFKILHHSIKLSNLPYNEKYFFSIRDPISRFRSAFFYRKNKGLPGVFQDWKLHEKKAFEIFSNANDLAENLFKSNTIGNCATAAMLSISHLCNQQSGWFEKNAFFDLRPPVHIIRQEHLKDDMNVLLKKLFTQNDYDLNLTDDENVSRKNKYPKDSKLSSLALMNLNKWYSSDIYFYKLCEDWIKNNS